MAGPRTAELIARLVDQVSGPAKGMAGALKGTSSELDKLTARSIAIDRFKTASRGLDDASQRFKVAQQNVRRLTTELGSVEGGSQKLGSALTKAKREADAAGKAFKAQGAKVREMRAALDQVGVPINRLAAYERELAQQTDRATAAFKRQQAAATAALGAGARSGTGRRLNAMSDAMHGARTPVAAGGGGAGGSAASALAGAGVARFGAAAAGIGGGAIILGDQIRRAAKSSMDFERTLIEVGKATDASGPELDAYGEKLMNLARETGQTKDALGSMLSAAGFAGRPKQELMDFTEYSAKAMSAWQTGAEETSQALAEIGNIYDAPQKRIEQIGDAINVMADNSASKESDLLEFMRRAGASSRTANISAEDTLAFGATMKGVGVRNETAGTAFEAMLNVMKLGEEFSKKAGEGIKGLGLKSDTMRKAFVAKPVETMIDLLERLNKVADPLKKAEIMTNLFGKEYQDDVAKILNALPKLNENLATMRDATKLAGGGVRMQFAQNLDKDVSKIDRATQAIDVLYKRLGDPIKIQAGGIADQVNKMVERLEAGDTTLQRFISKLRGAGDGDKKEAESDNPIARLSTSVLSTIDPKFGKSDAERQMMEDYEERARQQEKAKEILSRPGEIEARIRKQQGLVDEAKGATGMRRSLLADQAKGSEAQIAKLREDLAQAQDAIASLRVQQNRDRGAFGLDGPTGKQSDVGPGRTAFGFDVDNPTRLPAQRVPLPPSRPPELAPAPQVAVAPKVDSAQIDGLGTKADEATTKLTALGDLTVAPKGDASGLRAITAEANAAADALRQVISLSGQANVGINRVNDATGLIRARRIGSSPSFSDGVTPGRGGP